MRTARLIAAQWLIVGSRVSQTAGQVGALLGEATANSLFLIAKVVSPPDQPRKPKVRTPYEPSADERIRRSFGVED